MRMIFLAVVVLWSIAGAAAAQSWVQIEARPTQAQAEERAALWTEGLDAVNGFRLASGWYAIALGPYAEGDAEARLAQLRAARLIPQDSFISDGAAFRERFWGDGVTPTAVAPAPAPVPLTPGEETLAEARASERSLSRSDRADLQVALNWAGVYSGAIDAAFGPGTRQAMAAWQRANGVEATGVLTSLQRQEVLEGYRTAVRSVGLAPVRSDEAGIEIDLPLGLVRFDRIEAPFVHYTGDDDVTALLISQPGDRASFAALYDVLQSLEILPLGGQRRLERQSFTIEGENASVRSVAYAELSAGEIKGYLLAWPADDARRFGLAARQMRESFRPIDGVLPRPAAQISPSDELLAGLNVRRAERSRSGFYVDSQGSVLTTAAAVQGCGRVTLGDDTPLDAVAVDGGTGLALLRPTEQLAPIEVARLASAPGRLSADVAVAGYSFGGVLSAPTLTFGALMDLRGLDGNEAVDRLELEAADGDAGGPVFDASGAVLGILLDRPQDGRVLPPGVAFSTDASVIARFLSDNGVSARAADGEADLDPVALAQLGADVTVLVKCWG